MVSPVPRKVADKRRVLLLNLQMIHFYKFQFGTIPYRWLYKI